MKLAENIYKIHGEGNVYVYTGETPFVIDTGSYTERANIEARIKEIIEPEKIKFVLLTHMHYDHCGNVNLFPNAKILASKEEIEDYQKDSNWFFFGPEPLEIKHALKKIEPLPKKGEINGLRIESVPGHTRGSVYFVDEKELLLFSGDTIFHNGIGRIDLGSSVPGQMKDSVYKIYDDIRVNNLKLMPGHDY